jgi:hypothetical protein
MQLSDAMAIFGLIAIAMCWGFGVVLYRVGAAGSIARKLALLLIFEGLILVTAGYVELLLIPGVDLSSRYPNLQFAVLVVHTLGDVALLALYPPFLAAAIQTKLTRPFGNPRMRIGLVGVAVSIFVVVLFGPIEIGATLLYLMLFLLFTFAVVASIHAWHVAAPGIARTRARIFAVAFGFRDVCWGFIYAQGIYLIAAGLLDQPEQASFYIIYASGTFFAIPLIAYGILRTQLFDIDLRIRWTIKQSTLAAIIVTFIFLVSEGADRFLSAELGSFAGLLAAAVIVFFLTPLQRFAESVAGAAMPNTRNTPEYVAHRKMQVYEAALAEAQQEGGISTKERVLLNRLRDSLGISSADAEALERELQEGSVSESVVPTTSS